MSYCWVWETRPEPKSPPYFPIEDVWACADTFYRGLMEDFIETYNGVSASLLEDFVLLKFSIRYGEKGQFYFEQWKLQYGIIEFTLPLPEQSLSLLRAPDVWMERLHYVRCLGSLDGSSCPCRISGR